MDIQQLLAAAAEAKRNLDLAVADLLAELEAAKEEARDNPTDANHERRRAAVRAIQQYRAFARTDRAGTSVGGDARVTGAEG